MSESQAIIFRARESARVAMRDNRGESLRLIDGTEIGALSLRINTLKTNDPGPYHSHSVSNNLYYLLAGRIRIDSDVLTETLEPGDAAFFPAGTAHSATSVGDEPAQLLEVYCPGGPDFVEVESNHEAQVAPD